MTSVYNLTRNPHREIEDYLIDDENQNFTDISDIDEVEFEENPDNIDDDDDSEVEDSDSETTLNSDDEDSEISDDDTSLRRGVDEIENLDQPIRCDHEPHIKSKHDDNRTGLNLKYVAITFFVLVLATIYHSSIFDNFETKPKERPIRINMKQVDEINKKYPNLLSTKEIKIIKTRLSVMQREVSVLMLLGKSRDTQCKFDPTFCVGQAIVNATQANFGYVDASSPDIKSDTLDQELSRSFRGNRHSVMIDSLEKLPAPHVMNLFQYIDHDVTNHRRGMLLFVVYTGDSEFEGRPVNKTADAAENILVNSWSSHIPKDTLSSVISRMCRSIIKVY